MKDERPDQQPPALRLVLDTHIWLEWLLWRSPRIDPLRAGVAAGFLQLYYSSATLLEWQRVLGYPQFGLTAERIQTLVAALQSLAVCSQPELTLATLPQCRDPDDQKFLELAVQCEASFLLSRDKKLLKIGRHKGYKQRGLQVLSLERFYQLGVVACVDTDRSRIGSNPASE